MPRTKYIPEGSESIRFELKDTVESNFNRYQDALDQYPEAFGFLKLSYDQYLKTLSVYRREQSKDEMPEILFETVK